MAQQTPTTAVISRALSAAGLRHRTVVVGGVTRHHDFSVKKMRGASGEAAYTYVVFYNREAEELALRMASYIEDVCRSYGFPFTVKKVELDNGRWYVSMDNR